MDKAEMDILEPYLDKRFTYLYSPVKIVKDIDDGNKYKVVSYNWVFEIAWIYGCKKDRFFWTANVLGHKVSGIIMFKDLKPI